MVAKTADLKLGTTIMLIGKKVKFSRADCGESIIHVIRVYK